MSKKNEKQIIIYSWNYIKKFFVIKKYIQKVIIKNLIISKKINIINRILKKIYV